MRSSALPHAVVRASPFPFSSLNPSLLTSYALQLSS